MNSLVFHIYVMHAMIVDEAGMRILLVEPQAPLSQELRAKLMDGGADVTAVGSDEVAAILVAHERFDAVLFHSEKPDMSLATLIAGIRSDCVALPVIVLSGSLMDREALLAAGASDVVGPEVDEAALLAHLRALVRWQRGRTEPAVRAGDLALHLLSRVATVRGKSVMLTAKEFAILELLLVRRNIVLAKEAFVAHLYGDGAGEPDPKIIDVFICKIRRKLALAGASAMIGTVWGRGYVVSDGGPEHWPSVPAPYAPGHGTTALHLAPA